MIEKLFLSLLGRFKGEPQEICGPFWRKISTLRDHWDEPAAWELLIDNVEWLVGKGFVTTGELIKALGPEMAYHGIYCRGDALVNNGVAIAMGDARVVATGHSRVVLFDRAVCEAYDTTFVSLYHRSTAEVDDCVGQGFHSSRATVKGYGKFEAWDDCHVKAENYSYIILHDRAMSEQTGRVHVLRQ